MPSMSNGHGGFQGKGHGHGPGNSYGLGFGQFSNNGGGSGSGSLGLDRLPPQHLEAEQSVLGSIFINNDVLHDIVPLLSPEDFYRDSHQIIYRAITELYTENKSIDHITVSDQLKRSGSWDKIGGDEAILELINSVPSAAHAKYHADIVRQKSVVRQVISGAHQIIDEGFSGQYTADEVLQGAERRIFQIAEKKATGETHDFREVVVEAMSRITMRAEAKHQLSGITTGFVDLDQLTGGFHPAQLIIIAARPSMGKTAFALNICEHVALEVGKPVLFVSLEMGKMELAERLLCSKSRVDNSRMRSGQTLGTREMADLARGYNLLQKAPIFIDETPARNVLQINANSRRLKMRHGIGMVVIDYIQLVDGDEGGRESRQEQIAKISRRLKSMARELQVPVIALSQLNRGVEQREDHRPRMADLRESGAIEQDADMILLLHRPEYYDPNDSPGMAEVIVAKNRNGATGTAKLAFLKNFMRFENLAMASGQPIIDAGAF